MPPESGWTPFRSSQKANTAWFGAAAFGIVALAGAFVPGSVPKESQPLEQTQTVL